MARAAATATTAPERAAGLGRAGLALTPTAALLLIQTYEAGLGPGI